MKNRDSDILLVMCGEYSHSLTSYWSWPVSGAERRGEEQGRGEETGDDAGSLTSYWSCVENILVL